MLRAREGLPLGALVNGAQSGAGQGREPRPGLGFLPWPVTQKYLSKCPLVTVHPQEPQAAEGLIVGGIIIETFKFRLQFQINRYELRDEVFEIFLAIEIRAGFKWWDNISNHKLLRWQNDCRSVRTRWQNDCISGRMQKTEKLSRKTLVAF